jgi:hypothetical protein
MMDRRAFVAGTVALLAASLAAEAQQVGKPARLGIIYGSKPDFTPESNVASELSWRDLRRTATSSVGMW